MWVDAFSSAVSLYGKPAVARLIEQNHLEMACGYSAFGESLERKIAKHPSKQVVIPDLLAEQARQLQEFLQPTLDAGRFER